MNINVLKGQFLTYLQQLGTETNNAKYKEVVDTSYNIFDFSNEFKTFLEKEYNAPISIFSMDINELLKLEINNNQIISTDLINDIDNEINNINNQGEITTEEDNNTASSNEIVNEDLSEENNGTEIIEERVIIEEDIEGPDSETFLGLLDELRENENFIAQNDTDADNVISDVEFANFITDAATNDGNNEYITFNDLFGSIIESSTNNTTNNTTTNTTTPEIQNNTNNNISTNVIPFRPRPNGNSNLNNKLNELINDRNNTANSLNCNQNKYNTTQTDRNNCLNNLNNQLQTGQSNLNNSQQNVNDCQNDVNCAQQNVNQAANNLNNCQQDVNNCQEDVNCANDKANDATTNKNEKANNKQEKAQNEQNAQNDANTANNNLSTATNNTNNAQNTANEKEEELDKAVGATNEAFSVLNQANAEVSAAQNEYNNAQAEASSGVENAWEKFKNWVSSALAKLEAAISKRDAAETEAKQKEAEQEKAEVASEQAQNELQQRKTEQDRAQTVADAAQVVLDKATGEREVSDQEYADALITLATAMDERANAEDTYNSALSTYMEMKNYKADADGNLVDAEGNLVSAQQVVEEMETYIQGLSQEKEEEENSYNDILNTLSGVIEGDQTEIKNLDNEIKEVEKEIQEEEKLIALQEQMLQDLAVEKSEYNAQEETDGIWDDIQELIGKGSADDKKAIASKQEALEKALLSGSPEDVANAYKEIYGDKEIVINQNGEVVDTSSLSEEELKNCTVTTINSLNSKNINKAMNIEANNIENAKTCIDAINEGAVIYNGETISLNDINNLITQQAQDLVNEAKNAESQQGIISQLISNKNDILGIGSTTSNAQAQAQMMVQLSEKLNNCKTIDEYAATFKAITGQDFNITAIGQLLSYNNLNQQTVLYQSDTTDTGQIDITSYVSTLTNTSQENNLQKRDLSLFNNSTAREIIEDYKETQNTIKDAAIGVTTGVAAATAVALAPFTGGASLLLAAGVGAGTSLALNSVDSIYNNDNNDDLEINYNLKEAIKDTFTGAINGLFGTLANGIGTRITNSISNKLANSMLSKVLSDRVLNSFTQAASRAVGNAVEGGFDGGLSSGAEYIYNAIADEAIDFSMNEFLQKVGQGGLFGSIVNVGMGAGMNALSDSFNKIKKFATNTIDDTNVPILLQKNIDVDATTPKLPQEAEFPVVVEMDINGNILNINDNIVKPHKFSYDNVQDAVFEDVLDDITNVSKKTIDDGINIKNQEVDDAIELATKLQILRTDKNIAEYIAKNYDSDEISKFIELKSKGWSDAAAQENIFISNYMADNPTLNKYITRNNTTVAHESFFKKNKNLFENTHEYGWWTGQDGANSIHSARKMHLYSIDEADWQKMAESIIPYLKDNNINWKTINSNTPTTKLNSSIQKGKAFTIYPNDISDFKKIAADIDYIVRKNNLEIPESSIIGDRVLGSTNRIHYRYEYASGKFKDTLIDLDTESGYKKYKRMYESNRERVGKTNGQGSYLATDMTQADDPFRSFNPAEKNLTQTKRKTNINTTPNTNSTQNINNIKNKIKYNKEKLREIIKKNI